MASRYHAILGLTVGQLVFVEVVASPILVDGGDLVITAAVAWTLGQITGRRSDFWFLLIIGWTAPVLDMVAPWEAAPVAINAVKTALWLLFPAFLAQRLFVTIYDADAITHEEISGAISVYLLIGLVFANLYELLAIIEPTAIQWGPNFGDGVRTFADYVYFSFVTMAGVGYGDVAPASQLVRAAVVAQAITGLMYIAILIARFVGEQKRTDVI